MKKNHETTGKTMHKKLLLDCSMTILAKFSYRLVCPVSYDIIEFAMKIANWFHAGFHHVFTIGFSCIFP
jgi:hypothetical protein